MLLLRYCCFAFPFVLLAGGFFGSVPLGGQQLVDAAQTGEIAGRVVDAATGQPLSKMVIVADTEGRVFETGMLPKDGSAGTGSYAITDDDGSFSLSRVQAGRRAIRIFNPASRFSTQQRVLQVAAGETINSYEIRVDGPVTISGRVTDEAGRPVAHVEVFGVTSEFHAGQVRHYLRFGSITGADGRYTLVDMPAGARVRLVATWIPENHHLPHTEATQDELSKRPPIYSRMFYPGVRRLEDAAVLTLEGGMHRSGVDFTLTTEPSRCIAGQVERPTKVSRVRLQLEHDSPSYGGTRRGGTYGKRQSVLIAGDLRFRICGVGSGRYRLNAFNEAGDEVPPLAHYSSTSIDVEEQDVTGLTVPLFPRQVLSIGLEWAGDQPEPEVAGTARVSLEGLTRARFRGEKRWATSTIPGRAELCDVLVDQYTVAVQFPGTDPRILGTNPSLEQRNQGFYVRSVKADGKPLPYGLIDVGRQPRNAELQVVLASDAGSVRARVRDAEGEVISNAVVYLVPEDAVTPGAVEAALFVGQADQYGEATWNRSVPPGGYLAIARPRPVDYSPDSIGSLLEARQHAAALRVLPRGSSEVEIRLSEEVAKSFVER
jgi:hypothetical protein